MLYRYSCRGRPAWLEKKLLAFKSSLRKYQATCPCNCVLPPLVMTLIEDGFRPFSAEYADISTLTSATESIDGMLCTVVFDPVSRLVTPSTVMFLASLRPPRM